MIVYCCFVLLFHLIIGLKSAHPATQHIDDTALSLATAIRHRNATIVAAILARRPQLASAYIVGLGEANSRTTALHVAVENDATDAARLLLEKGALVAVTNTPEKANALFWAVHRNASAEMLRLIIKNIADFDLLDQRDANGRTPLMEAVAQANIAAVRLLVDNEASADLGDLSNCSFPLSTAVHLKSSLLTMCANFTMHDDLFVQCERKYEKIYKAMISLLLEAGADPYRRDICSNKTAYDVAQELQDSTVLKMFDAALTGTRLRQLELFDAIPHSRCSGVMKKSTVRMISVEECATVCEELPNCFGFNLMLSATSGSRGNGCILKLAPCQLQRDMTFAFYRRKPVAAKPEMVNLTFATESTPVRGMLIQNDYLPTGGIQQSTIMARSPPESAALHQPQTYGYNSIYPGALPPNVNTHFGDNHAVYSRPIERPINECGRIAWYGWLLIGVAGTALGCSAMYCFLFRQWKTHFIAEMNQKMQLIHPATGYVNGQYQGSSTSISKNAAPSDICNNNNNKLQPRVSWSDQLEPPNISDNKCKIEDVDESVLSNANINKRRPAPLPPVGGPEKDVPLQTERIDEQERAEKKRTNAKRSTGTFLEPLTSLPPINMPQVVNGNECGGFRCATVKETIKEPVYEMKRQSIKSFHKVYVDWNPSLMEKTNSTGDAGQTDRKGSGKEKPGVRKVMTSTDLFISPTSGQEEPKKLLCRTQSSGNLTATNDNGKKLTLFQLNDGRASSAKSGGSRCRAPLPAKHCWIDSKVNQDQDVGQAQKKSKEI